LSEADLRLFRDAVARDGGDLSVPLTGLIRAAAERLRPASEVAERLALLGFTVPDTASMPYALTRDDTVLTENQIGDQSWLDPAAPVTIAHVMLAAEEISRDAAYAARRLAELGYQSPDFSGTCREDMALIRALAGRRTSHLSRGFRPIDQEVRLLNIARASLELDRPATAIADRPRYLGYTVPDVASLLPRGRPGPVSSNHEPVPDHLRVPTR
jgi:hypothetical protein